MACPPTIPSIPLAFAILLIRPNLTAALGCVASLESISNANDCKASPTRIAVASFHFLCTVGFPLRKSSLSIAGKSSCTSEYECIHSIAAAA